MFVCVANIPVIAYFKKKRNLKLHNDDASLIHCDKCGTRIQNVRLFVCKYINYEKNSE